MTSWDWQVVSVHWASVGSTGAECIEDYLEFLQKAHKDAKKAEEAKRVVRPAVS